MLTWELSLRDRASSGSLLMANVSCKITGMRAEQLQEMSGFFPGSQAYYVRRNLAQQLLLLSAVK